MVSGFSKPRNSPDKDVWVGLFGTNNRVDHSLFERKTSKSPIVMVWRSGISADYQQIDHNYFRDIPPLGENGVEAIRVGTSEHSLSDSHIVMEFNIFENSDGEGELISVKSGRNILRYNTVIKSKGSISLRYGNYNEVFGNYIFEESESNTGGIRVMGENHIVYDAAIFQNKDGVYYPKDKKLEKNIIGCPLKKPEIVWNLLKIL